jgi:hypothetical protein
LEVFDLISGQIERRDPISDPSLKSAAPRMTSDDLPVPIANARTPTQAAAEADEKIIRFVRSALHCSIKLLRFAWADFVSPLW